MSNLILNSLELAAVSFFGIMDYKLFAYVRLRLCWSIFIYSLGDDSQRQCSKFFPLFNVIMVHCRKITRCVSWCPRLRGEHFLRRDIPVAMVHLLLWLQNILGPLQPCKGSLRILERFQFRAISPLASIGRWVLQPGSHPWRQSHWSRFLMLIELRTNRLKNLLTFGMMYVSLHYCYCCASTLWCHYFQSQLIYLHFCYESIISCWEICLCYDWSLNFVC